MAATAELLCHHCSLSYNPPMPTQSSPSDARRTVHPPSPLRHLFRPPERRRRQFRRARATGSMAGRLWALSIQFVPLYELAQAPMGVLTPIPL